jgi:ribosome-binding ATPase
MEHLGLVGLPDSGHAQLFSALTGIDTPTGFETTKGVAPLPDDRVDRLAEMSKSKKRVHATFEIDFIPGLAPGGKPGEGLGSRLLGSIRDCDAILAVVRAGDDAAAGPATDPSEALGTLELELVLADLASVEQRLDKQRRALKGDATLAGEVAALERAQAVLAQGTPVYRSDLSAEERALLGPVFLLTNKPMLVVVNVAVDRLDQADELAKPFGPDALAVCVEIEGDPDVAQAPPDERAALLADLGVSESVLPRLARSAYHLLGRRTFLTTGDKESRAWSFRAGARAPECAGVIHSDLQRGFIRAEVIDWRDLIEIGSWDKAKELGKIRVEGKEYEVQDGDVLEIRFNV